MKAIFLAAGEGKRLRPYTEKTPKSMVKLWGESMLERQIKQLKVLGINDITIVTGYCADSIESLNEKTVVNSEFNSTNMVYSLAKYLPLLEKNDDVIIILYGDIAYNIDNLVALTSSKSESPMTVLANLQWLTLWQQRLENPLSDAETFIYDEKNRLQEIGKKPNSLDEVQAQYMGMIKVNQNYLITVLSQYVKQATTAIIQNMYMTDLIQQCADKSDVEVISVNGGWIEMDTIEDYQLYSDKAPIDFNL